MRHIFSRTFPLQRLPLWIRYGSTVLVVLTALALQDRLSGIFNQPFLVFLPTVLLSAVLFDRGSGILAAVLSAGLSLYFIEPQGSFAVSGIGNLAAAALFLGIALTTAFIIETVHITLRDLVAAHDKLKGAHGRISASEREKDTLLIDLSHRVQNDLNMMVMLLQMEARTATDLGSARKVITAAADRLKILGRVHQRLSRRRRDAVVDSRGFIEELCDELRATHIGFRPIAMRIDAESHQLSEHRTLLVGLILNELMTNAFKHAFPADGAGAVTIQFVGQNGNFSLSVADDGVGMQEPRAGRRGLGIIEALTQQLGGAFEMTPRHPGTICAVRFPVEQANETAKAAA